MHLTLYNKSATQSEFISSSEDGIGSESIEVVASNPEMFTTAAAFDLAWVSQLQRQSKGQVYFQTNLRKSPRCSGLRIDTLSMGDSCNYEKYCVQPA